MKQQIELVSPSYGRAVIVLVSWGDSMQATHIQFFNKGITRLEALQHGADLMGWFDSMCGENPSELPFDWCVLSSCLDD